MTQGRRGAWLKGLCGGVVLGVWGLACGPVPESDTPVDEVVVEQGAADEAEWVDAQRNTPAPLPPNGKAKGSSTYRVPDSGSEPAASSMAGPSKLQTDG